MTSLNENRTSGHPRYGHIDAMRAFSVLVVVIAHAGLGNIIPGGSGVTIFFAISGFVITWLLLRERSKSGGFDVVAFYVRRIFKLAPPFLVIVAVPTLVFVVFGGAVSAFDFLSQTFFFFNWVYMVAPVEVLPGSAVIWSLSIEEQFYIAFALVWLVIARKRTADLTVLLLSAALVVAPLTLRVIISMGSVDHYRTYYGTDTRIDGIAWGILAAVIFAKLGGPSARRDGRYQRAIGHWSVLLVAVAVYLVSLLVRDEFFRETLRYSFQSVAAAAIILYGFFATGPTGRLFLAVANLRIVQVIGLASYSIYLVHLEVVNLLDPAVGTLGLLPRTAIYSVAGIAAGLAIWFTVERWAERRKANFVAKRDLRISSRPLT